jgi:hypothetical protein
MTDVIGTIGADAKTLFNDFVTDALPVAVPAIETFNTEMAGTPSATEFAAASAQLEATLIAQGPAVLQAWVKQVNAMISGLASKFEASVSAGASSGTTSTGS